MNITNDINIWCCSLTSFVFHLCLLSTCLTRCTGGQVRCGRAVYTVYTVNASATTYLSTCTLTEVTPYGFVFVLDKRKAETDFKNSTNGFAPPDFL